MQQSPHSTLMRNGKDKMTTLNMSNDMSFRSILMATDFSEASLKAQRHAISIARHFHAKFYMAHIISSVGLNMAGADALELAASVTRREMAELERHLIQNGGLADLSHEFIVRQGDIWEELEDIIREHHVEIIVIGTQGRHGIEKFVLGSVAEKIFREADQLVLTVGPHSKPDAPLEGSDGTRPFLFPTNFSEASKKALPHAISFCNHFGAKLVLLHVAPASRATTPGSILGEQEIARCELLARLQVFLPSDVPLSVTPEFMVEFGDHGEQILNAAQSLKSDLIIMGLDHSRHGRAVSHLPRTTTYQVVCQAPCSVLTARN
jgi:nucleotide-binding universal stress UspA family protein